MTHREHPLKVGDIITAPRLGDGQWIVIAAQWAGGGQNFDGAYPDGWSVTLIPDGDALPFLGRLTKQRVRYQDGTGAFCDEHMLGPFTLAGAKWRNKVKR